MNAAYLFRLVCLSLASFFLVNGIAGAVTMMFSNAAIRIAETMKPRSAARFLFILRMLPAILGLSAVLGLCIPSYLWLEPQIASERVGLACLLLAALAAIGCFRSLVRTAGAIRASARLRSEWRYSGNRVLLKERVAPGISDEMVTVVRNNEPLLALSGFFRPRVIVSRSVLAELPIEQLEVAVLHEIAHRNSCDNLKRLFLVLSPEFFPFANGFAAIEKTWAKISEWAADDEAVERNSHRALSLATALLRVARMGARPQLSILQTSLLPVDHDLAARVNRLLCLDQVPLEKLPHVPSRAILHSLCFAACALMLVGVPATLASVHRLLELFLH